MTVIAIQSQVVHARVGNSAAQVASSPFQNLFEIPFSFFMSCPAELVRMTKIGRAFLFRRGVAVRRHAHPAYAISNFVPLRGQFFVVSPDWNAMVASSQ
jgi:hypothetical protein